MTSPFILTLVRHGEAAASWDTATDPGLSQTGQTQADALRERLRGAPSRRVLASPLRRAQETAAPLAAAWQKTVLVEHAVRELPSTGVPMATRREWLKGVAHATWPAVDAPLRAWRDEAWMALCGLAGDTVVFTHFMLINAIVSRALGDDRTVCFEPDYCSVTTLERTADGFRVLELGATRETLVLL